MMVLFTMFIAAFAVAGPAVPWVSVLNALVGVGLVVVGAVVFNQRMEWGSDARMARTMHRPIPAGRLSLRTASTVATLCTAFGLGYLALTGPPMLIGLTALSWFLYVGVYTPLKSVSIWQTPVGAVAGAMPVVLGMAAVGRVDDPLGWLLFAVLYFWQFPHAMAVARLYREQFSAAQIRVAPVVDRSGRLAAWMTVAGGLLLLVAVCLPWQWGLMGTTSAAGLVAVTMAYLGVSVYFVVRDNPIAARRLLHTSLVYLPVALLVFLFA